MKTVPKLSWYRCPVCGLLGRGVSAPLHEAAEHPPVQMVPYVGPPPPVRRCVGEIQADIERLEPYLRRTAWPAISGMIIPGMLKKADEVEAELLGYDGPDDEEFRELLERLRSARAEFERLRERRRLKAEAARASAPATEGNER